MLTSCKICKKEFDLDISKIDPYVRNIKGDYTCLECLESTQVKQYCCKCKTELFICRVHIGDKAYCSVCAQIELNYKKQKCPKCNFEF